MSQINPWEAGRVLGELSQAVETLTEEVKTLRGEMAEIKGAAAKGRGILWGAALMAGAGTVSALDWLKGAIARATQ